MVYDLLRHQIGNETFYQAWQYIYSQARHQNLRTRDIQQLFEDVVGESLDWFFDPWVYGSGVVTLSLGATSMQPSENGWTIAVQIHQLQPTYVQLLVPVVIETIAGGQVVWLSLPPLESSTLTIEIETSDVPLRLYLDPARLLLCTYGTNSILLSLSPGSPIPLIIIGAVCIVVVVSIAIWIFRRRKSQTA